jgi:HTH-type transcriptional regulator/antitoxin HipB
MAETALTTSSQVGAAVRGARRQQGLTQSALAERAGVSRRWLITLENGQAERAELGKILDTFDALGLDLVLTGKKRDESRLSDLLEDL